jgi:hypothetical protein
MATEDASLRQDLIENAVQHEVVPIEEAIPTEQSLDASFAAELEHDLTTWPREYLESYLDSNDQGRIPLNEATLQDLLEAAFDRNEQLIHSSRHSLISETAANFEEQDHAGEQFPYRGKAPERSESFQAAKAQAHSVLGPSAETRYPLIQNGVYVGNIISETAEYLVQRISGTTAILHPKSMFSDLPEVGHVVRIAYYNENVAVREMAARQISKELAR